MILKSAAIDQIASFICGDAPLPFPYRSSWYLTKFFTGLGLDYTHNGESRNSWAFDVVKQINDSTSSSGPLFSKEISSIICELVNPFYFSKYKGAETPVSQENALIALNAVLSHYDAEVKIAKDTGVISINYRSGATTTANSAGNNHPTETYIEKYLQIKPVVFKIPESTVIQNDLVSVMMPFGGFNDVYDAIKNACIQSGFRCKRADDIWVNTTILQDIFDLILVSNIVIVDFSNKNPNVMYETGIAHTLGKTVIPISQSLDHLPSDLQSHRVLTYLKNSEGLSVLQTRLTEKLKTIKDGHNWER